MFQTVLYLHILAACSWIGGSILLFALGILIRDGRQQSAVYGVIGPLYGYFESFWLFILLATGFWLLDYHSLVGLIGKNGSELEYMLNMKILAVSLVLVATAVHLFVAIKTHGKNRTTIQTLLSRGGSLAIFFLNFAILRYAIEIRSVLH